jgi:hypothetical protein
VRSYSDVDEFLEDLDGLHVDVVPAGYRRVELQTPYVTNVICLTAIIVRKRFSEAAQLDNGTIDQTKADELVTLCEAIHKSLAAQRIRAFEDAVWEDTDFALQFERKHLREARQFTAVIRVAYRVPVSNL